MAKQLKKKEWTPLQAARIAADGYYVDRTERFVDVQCIMNGMVRLVRSMRGWREWGTLNWNAAHTKKKLQEAGDRIWYFPTHEVMVSVLPIEDWVPGALVKAPNDF